MLTRLLACATAAAALACAQSGHWEATLHVNERDITLSLDLAKSAAGVWTGSMGVPAQNVTGLLLKDLAVNEKSVKFRVLELPQQPALDLTLMQEKLSGVISTPSGSLPIEFERTGDAKVEVAAANPAVPKELEGNWLGTLDTPKGALRVLVHFKNQPDKTVQATLDSPDQGAQGLPLNDVKQTGRKVEFQLKRIGGGFSGTLNKDATEISGQFTQGGADVPLVFKKQ